MLTLPRGDVYHPQQPLARKGSDRAVCAAQRYRLGRRGMATLLGSEAHGCLVWF
jgi:hypothetical protein